MGTPRKVTSWVELVSDDSVGRSDVMMDSNFEGGGRKSTYIQYAFTCALCVIEVIL